MKIEIHIPAYDPDGSQLESARKIAKELSFKVNGIVSIAQELGNVIMPVTNFSLGRELAR
jgi:hypothetical protein